MKTFRLLSLLFCIPTTIWKFVESETIQFIFVAVSLYWSDEFCQICHRCIMSYYSFQREVLKYLRACWTRSWTIIKLNFHPTLQDWWRCCSIIVRVDFYGRFACDFLGLSMWVNKITTTRYQRDKLMLVNGTKLKFYSLIYSGCLMRFLRFI